MKKYIITLTEEEKQELELLVRQRSAKSDVVIKAQILLATALNGLALSDEGASELYGMSTRSVERLRERFCQEGMKVALERKKQLRYRERKLTGEVEAHLTLLCCSSPPAGYSRWTLHLLADELVELKVVESISTTSVMNALKKTSLNRGGKRCG